MNQLPGRGPLGSESGRRSPAPRLPPRDAHPRAGAARPHPSGAERAQGREVGSAERGAGTGGLGPWFWRESVASPRSPRGRACPRRPDGRGSHPEPPTGNRGPPPASSGFDKLNLRALEKLQEEESKECAEWLEGALSPRELRPPRASPRLARPRPSRARARAAREGPGAPAPPFLAAPGCHGLPHLPDRSGSRPPPRPPPSSPAPARAGPRVRAGSPPPTRMTTSAPAAPPERARGGGVPGGGAVARRVRAPGAGTRLAGRAGPTAGPSSGGWGWGEGARPRPSPAICALAPGRRQRGRGPAPGKGPGPRARRAPGRPTDLCEFSGAP